MDEKAAGLPSISWDSPYVGKKSRQWKYLPLIFVGTLTIILAWSSGSACLPSLQHWHRIPAPVATSQCPEQLSIGPKSHPEITDRNILKLFPSAEFKNLSVTRLQGAVQIPTVSYDDNGPLGEDPRWDVFYDLEDYFKTTFPLL